MDPRYEQPTTPVFRRASSLVIGLLMVVGAMGCSTGGGDSLTGGEQPVPATGTIRVTVTSGGSLIQGAVTIKVTGPIEQTRAGAIGGTSTFVNLPAGTYAVAATSPNRAIACQSATANLVAGASATADITCTPRTGTIRGTVSNGGAPISGATIKLTGSSRGEITTRADGTFMIIVMIGEVTIATSHAAFVCPEQNVMVEEAQAATANISCTPKTTGSIRGRIVLSGDELTSIGNALVTLTGAANLTTTSGNYDGRFVFLDLPAGGYTLTADDFGIDCQEVSVNVQAGQTIEVRVRCSFLSFPNGSEIEGAWWYYRRLDSQIGSCPTPLPETGTGTMRFDSSNSTIAVVGLDPELTIVGRYDSGAYTGIGRAVLSNGSSIETTIQAGFGFDWWGYSDDPTYFSTGFDAIAFPSQVMVRRHRDASGNLLCTETYQASGTR